MHEYWNEYFKLNQPLCTAPAKQSSCCLCSVSCCHSDLLTGHVQLLIPDVVGEQRTPLYSEENLPPTSFGCRSIQSHFLLHTTVCHSNERGGLFLVYIDVMAGLRQGEGWKRFPKCLALLPFAV